MHSINFKDSDKEILKIHSIIAKFYIYISNFLCSFFKLSFSFFHSCDFGLIMSIYIFIAGLCCANEKGADRPRIFSGHRYFDQFNLLYNESCIYLHLNSKFWLI